MSEWLDVLEERHAEEIGDPAGSAITILLIRLEGGPQTLENAGGVAFPGFPNREHQSATGSASSPQDESPPPAQRLRRDAEPESRSPPQESGDRDLPFQAGERRAQAVMDPESEGEMLVRLAGEI